MHPGEALDGRAIEADPVPKRALKLGGRDGDGLKGTEHVGEPEPDEPDVPLLQRPQYELFLPVHISHLRRSDKLLLHLEALHLEAPRWKATLAGARADPVSPRLRSGA